MVLLFMAPMIRPLEKVFGGPPREPDRKTIVKSRIIDEGILSNPIM